MKREKAFTRKVDSKTGLTKVKLSNREDYWAFEDGKVRLGDDDVLQVYEEWFDGDMGLWWEGEPYVFIGESEHKYFLDDIMKDVGFVQGGDFLWTGPAGHHGELYARLIEKFYTPEIDSSGSDLARGNYLCYDPTMWMNSNPEPFHFEHDPGYSASSSIGQIQFSRRHHGRRR